VNRGPLALAFWLSVAATGCSHEPSSVPIGSFPGAPIILISIDTLRADHLSLYGYKAASTPVLERLAANGIVFDDVYSHCPLTLPSHTSLLTGRLPLHHGVRDNIGYTVASDEKTLASRLKGAGYATGAAISAYVLRHQTGIDRGFDFFDDAIEMAGTGESLSDTQRDGGLTVDALSTWIDGRAGDRVFAFLHLYEPHTPYAPPPSHRLAQPYDGEIAYADELVGRFMDRLAARHLLDRAIVAVVSDHGEGLGDHGEAEHGVFLYREALRVPWILKLPGNAHRGIRVAGTAGLVDVAPTLLDLAGVPPDGKDASDGRSLVAALSARRVTDRTVYSETLYPRLHFGWSDLASAVDGRYHYIRAPQRELYDIASDPQERVNLTVSKPSTAASLDGWLNRTTTGSVIVQPADADHDVRERLRALGYITSSAPPASATLADPKDEIAGYEELRRAQQFVAQARDREAIGVLEPLTARQPGMLDAWELLAKSQVKLGQIPKAIDAFSKVLAIDPLKPETHLALARIFALERQPARAREHAELAARRDPAAAYETIAELMMDAGRLDDAAAFADRSIAADGSRYMSHFVRAVVAQRRGRCDEAIVSFRRAIDAKRLEPHAVVRNLHAGLADCLARQGQAADAEREFHAELVDVPWSPEGRVGLATLYRSQQRDADARTVLAGVVTTLPQPNADAYWTVVHAFTVLGDTAAAQEWRAKAHARFPKDGRFR
jgi:arylsulfatase A-like enzyme/Tfp pilus assembly protein PilF